MPHGAVPFPFGDCRVCGDKATGSHYGVSTCEGCKGFFKRSIPKADRYKCFFGGSCVISPQNRNRCKSCRFKRCATVGMAIEAVKMGRIPKVDKERALQEHSVGVGTSTSHQEEPPDSQSQTHDGPPNMLGCSTADTFSGPMSPVNSGSLNLVNNVNMGNMGKHHTNHDSSEKGEKSQGSGENLHKSNFSINMLQGISSDLDLSHRHLGLQAPMDKSSLEAFRLCVWDQEQSSKTESPGSQYLQHVHHVHPAPSLNLSLSRPHHDHRDGGQPTVWSSDNDKLSGVQDSTKLVGRQTSGGHPDHGPARAASTSWSGSTGDWAHRSKTASTEAVQSGVQDFKPLKVCVAGDTHEEAVVRYSLKDSDQDIYVEKHDAGLYMEDTAPRDQWINSNGQSLPSTSPQENCSHSASSNLSSRHSNLSNLSSYRNSSNLSNHHNNSSNFGGDHGNSSNVSGDHGNSSSLSSQGHFSPTVINELITQIVDSGQGPELERTLKSQIHKREPLVPGDQVPLRDTEADDLQAVSYLQSKPPSVEQAYGDVMLQNCLSHDTPHDMSHDTPHDMSHDTPHDMSQVRSLSARFEPSNISSSKRFEPGRFNSDSDSHSLGFTGLVNNDPITLAPLRAWDMDPSVETTNLGARPSHGTQHSSMPHDLTFSSSVFSASSEDDLGQLPHTSYNSGTQSLTDRQLTSDYTGSASKPQVHLQPEPQTQPPSQHSQLKSVPHASLQTMETDDADEFCTSLLDASPVQDLPSFPGEEGPSPDPSTDETMTTPDLHISIDELKEKMLFVHTKEFWRIRRAERLMKLDVDGILPKHPLNTLTMASRKQVQFLWDQLMGSVPISTTMIIGLCSSFPLFNKIIVSDQAILMREAYFDLWLITHASLFYGGESYLRLPCNGCYSRWWMNHILPDSLIKKMFDFTEGLNDCNLQPVEILLICAIQLINPEREGLTNVELIRDINNRYLDILAYIIEENHQPSHGRILVRIFRLLPNLDPINKEQAGVIGMFRVDSFPEEIKFSEESFISEDKWQIDLKFSEEFDPEDGDAADVSMVTQMDSS